VFSGFGKVQVPAWEQRLVVDTRFRIIEKGNQGKGGDISRTIVKVKAVTRIYLIGCNRIDLTTNP
jgi:hypothetical protein